MRLTEFALPVSNSSSSHVFVTVSLGKCLLTPQDMTVGEQNQAFARSFIYLRVSVNKVIWGDLNKVIFLYLP